MPGKKKHFCKVPNCDFWSFSMVGTSFLRTSDSAAMKSRADAVGMLVDDILPSHRICHKHFDDSDFIYGDNNFKRLRLDAVPSKFLVSSFTTRILHIFSIVLLQFTSKLHCLKITKKISFIFFITIISYIYNSIHFCLK